MHIMYVTCLFIFILINAVLVYRVSNFFESVQDMISALAAELKRNRPITIIVNQDLVIPIQAQIILWSNSQMLLTFIGTTHT